jgi:hypothetical protein
VLGRGGGGGGGGLVRIQGACGYLNKPRLRNEEEEEDLFVFNDTIAVT